MGVVTLLKGLGLGAGLAYFLDPDRGHRRRAFARDQANAALSDLETFVEKASRDLSNRVRGTFAELQAAMTTDTADDQVIAERVRSRLGHFLSHPRAIHVTARDGRIIVEGHVAETELDEILGAISAVRGVREVENRLRVQGESAEGALHQEHRANHRGWTPAARLVASAAGAGLIANCLLRPSAGRILTGALGAALFARAAGKGSLHRLGEVTTHWTHARPGEGGAAAAHRAARF